MGKYNSAVITTAGQNFFASAIAGGNEVIFTTAQTSTTVYSNMSTILALTSLTNVKQTADITGSGVYNNNVVQVTMMFNNDSVATAYLINTLGISAKVSGGSPVLVAVITADTADEMPVADPVSPSAFAYNVQMVIQNASSLTVTVTSTGTVTVAQLDQYLYDKLNVLTNITIPTAGWNTGSLPYTVDVLVAGYTANTVPIDPTINYPSACTKAQKRTIDKAANLLTRMITGAGKVTVEAVEVPTTAIPITLRGF